MGISAREFARRDGCSDMLVRRAGKAGKLTVNADGTYDEAQVGGDWRPRDRDVRTVAANSDANTEEVFASKSANKKPSKQRAPSPLSAAVVRKEEATAALKELEFKKKSGDLVEIADAEAVMFEQFRIYRDSWLNWPVRVAPMIAAELGLDIDKIAEVLKRHVHQHLADLGEPEGDFAEQD